MCACVCVCVSSNVRTLFYVRIASCIVCLADCYMNTNTHGEAAAASQWQQFVMIGLQGRVFASAVGKQNLSQKDK